MRLVVDSASRNRLLWPDADAYEVQLKNPIKDVVSLELVETDVEFSAPTIGRGNDLLYISYLGSVRTVQLVHGNYATLAPLLTMLSSVLSTTILDLVIFAEDADADGKRIQLRSPDDDFEVCEVGLGGVDEMGRAVAVGRERSAARVLGLAAGTVLASSGRIARFPYRACFDPEPFLFLSLDCAGCLETTDPGVERAFATLTNGHREIRHPDTVAVNPRRSLQKLKVVITRRNGHGYDFAGKEHRLEFCVNGGVRGCSSR